MAVPIIIAAGIAAYSIGKGISDKSKAKKGRKQYEEMMGAIPLQDPAMVGLLGETRRRRRAFEAGTDPMTAYTQQQIGAQGAQTQANAVRAGSRGVSDLLRVQAGTNRGFAESGARASQQANGMFALEGDLVRAMEQRAYRRQMSDAQLVWNEAARLREDGDSQIAAGLGMAGSIAGGGYGGMGKSVGAYNNPVGGKSIDNSLGNNGAPVPDYLTSSGYRSRKNYGFNYMPPSPNYGFNI